MWCAAGVLCEVVWFLFACVCVCCYVFVCVVCDGSCGVVSLRCYCFCVFDCSFVENVIGCCDCELLCGDV